MDYRGVRYALQTSIVRRQWKVVVYIKENEPVERTVTGSRRQAEAVAHTLIDRLLSGGSTKL